MGHYHRDLVLKRISIKWTYFDRKPLQARPYPESRPNEAPTRPQGPWPIVLANFRAAKIVYQKQCISNSVVSPDGWQFFRWLRGPLPANKVAAAFSSAPLRGSAPSVGRSHQKGSVVQFVDFIIFLCALITAASTFAIAVEVIMGWDQAWPVIEGLWKDTGLEDLLPAAVTSNPTPQN